MNIRNAALASCLAFLATLAEPDIRAESFSVGVRCEIKSTQLKRLYGLPRVSEMTAKLCSALIGRLERHSEFSLWNYGSSAQRAAWLVLEVLDRGSDVTIIEMRFIPSEGYPVRLSDTWIQIGDAHPADSDLAQTSLEAEFGSRLEGPWKPRLLDGLRQIPVGEARSLEPPGSPPLRIISSLAWSKYQHLRSSHFKVVCPRPGHASTTLTSKGRPTPALFKPTDSRVPYDALVVVVTGRIENTPDSTVTPISNLPTGLSQLKPRILLFDRFDPPGFEIYLQ